MVMVLLLSLVSAVTTKIPPESTSITALLKVPLASVRVMPLVIVMPCVALVDRVSDPLFIARLDVNATAMPELVKFRSPLTLSTTAALANEAPSVE